MKNLLLASIITVLLSGASHAQSAEPSAPLPLNQTIQEAIVDLIDDNAAFLQNKEKEDFKPFQDIQNPRVTMVMCADSRVQTDNFSKGAENDLFVARNIGNQFATTQGSVEYGVDVLKTPVLIFVGHSHCGAVKAARGDISKLPPAIRRELSTMDVKAAPNEKQAVALNVHNQVDQALSQFKDKVDSKDAVILGAIYDFRNDYGYGKGQLILINFNGEKDPQKIREALALPNIEHFSIGLLAAN